MLFRGDSETLARIERLAPHSQTEETPSRSSNLSSRTCAARRSPVRLAICSSRIVNAKSFAQYHGKRRRRQIEVKKSHSVFYDLLTLPARPRCRSTRHIGMITQSAAVLRRGFVVLVVVGYVALALTTATKDGATNSAPVEKPLLAGSNVPASVRSILQRACQDCHSENTIWPWYANVPPLSSHIHKDVARGRAFMDLSKWNAYTEGQRRGFMAAIVTSLQDHVMPPPKYVWLHPEARLSGAELNLVKAWALATSSKPR